MRYIILLLVAALLVVAVKWFSAPRPLGRAELLARYTAPLPPQRPNRVYHLGHSLVGRDMPVILKQLMGGSYSYNSQLGWGASLDQHWREDVPGFAEENAPPAFRPAQEAIGSGDYDAIILTEMVELKDAIRYHDSARALADWAALARKTRPDVRIYLYETWHRLDDPQGWASRIERDLGQLWEGALLAGAMAREGTGTIHVIPGGQAMAAVAREIEAGRLPGLTSPADLFARNADGTQDTIHPSDTGNYVIALTHYAVLTGESPVGLPHRLLRADGSPATLPDPVTIQRLQEVVWDVVRSYALSGVSG